MTRRKAVWAVILVLAVSGLWWLVWGRSAGTGVSIKKPRRARTGSGAGLRNRLGLLPGQRVVTAISGVVRDEHGGALAGAVVCSWPSSRDLAREDVKDPFCAQSDAHGTFVLSRLVPARYRLHASAPRFIPSLYEAADGTPFVDLKLGEHRTGVNFVLRGGGVAVRGLVKDIGGGGIPRAFVRVMSAGGGRSAAAVNLLAKAGYRRVYSVVDGFEGDMVKDPQSAQFGKRAKNGWKNSALPWTYALDPKLLPSTVARLSES